ncbi:hypothetical protein Tco_1515960 [Tanacetum coccineum]
MATSWMCCSVGILFHHSRLFIKVNAQQGDHVDEVMLISKTSEEECNQEFDAIFQDYEDIQSMLFDDYKTLQMELTIDHGAVDTVRLFNEFGQELDDVKAFENSLKITGFSKEKEDVGEICVICNEEYKVGEMTATMECEDNLLSGIRQKTRIAIDALGTFAELTGSQVRCKQPLVVVYAEWEFTRIRSWTAFTSKKDYGKEETVGSCSKDTPRTLDTSNLKYLQRKATGLSEIA